MEYYSAITRNSDESVLVRWMSLEPVTQSEVRKRKTNVIYINAHIWNLEKLVLINLLAGQEQRCRNREQTWTQRGRWGRGIENVALKHIQSSRSGMSNSLWPHGLQHARPPCPLLTPRVYSNSCSLKSVMPSSHLILCRPLLFLPSVLPSIRVFQIVSSSHQVAKVLEFQHQSFQYSGLASFRIDWLGLLAVQGNLKSLLQHHSSKASVVQHSVFSTVQLSHPYMTTGKTIALTRWTSVGKVMSLVFNMLARLVILFFQGVSVLISWVQSPSVMIFGAPKNKVSHCFHHFTICLPWSDWTRCHNHRFLNVEF